MYLDDVQHSCKPRRSNGRQAEVSAARGFLADRGETSWGRSSVLNVVEHNETAAADRFAKAGTSESQCSFVVRCFVVPVTIAA